jgi:hypothetical protein
MRINDTKDGNKNKKCDCWGEGGELGGFFWLGERDYS